MNRIRGFFAKMKGAKKDKRKPDRMRAEVSGLEGSNSTSLPSRPELHVRVGGSNGREGYEADVERREASQRNLHPDVEVAVQSGPNREGGHGDIYGKKPDRSVDPLYPSPSAPSTSHEGEPEST